MRVGSSSDKGEEREGDFMRRMRRNKAKRFRRENFSSCKAMPGDAGVGRVAGGDKRGGGDDGGKWGCKKGEEVKGREGESRGRKRRLCGRKVKPLKG